MSKQTEQINKKISDLMHAAFLEGVKEVERLARKTMKRNPTGITCFCMAMGTATFYDKDGHSMFEGEDKLNEFYSFLHEHNRSLYLTGNPMKIDGKWDAPLVTKW